MKEKYILFYNGVFSNWYPSVFTDETGKRFVTSEQYMMYKKALTFGDVETAEKIMQATHPSTQKQLGREVKGFVREQWDAVSRDEVYKGCYFKFEQNPQLKKELLETEGTILVEASPSDNIWGIGLSESNPDAYDETKWKGTNWLGKVLTKLRDDMLANNVNLDVKHFS
jgi:ribA/ribD-fused uncharacterized protein